MTVNIDLMRETLSYIETHPEQWGQHDFRRCFAAHAAQLAGAQWVVSADSDVADETSHLYYMVMVRADETGPYRMTSVWTHAKTVLGVTEQGNMPLFRATNTIDDLRQMIDEYAAEAVPV